MANNTIQTLIAAQQAGTFKIKGRDPSSWESLWKSLREVLAATPAWAWPDVDFEDLPDVPVSESEVMLRPVREVPEAARVVL